MRLEARKAESEEIMSVMELLSAKEVRWQLISICASVMIAVDRKMLDIVTWPLPILSYKYENMNQGIIMLGKSLSKIYNSTMQ